MSRPSKWTVMVWALLVAILGIEIAATLSHDPKPKTISEHLWGWFPRGWRRVLLVGLMALLTWHFWSGPDVQQPYYQTEAGLP